MEKQEKKERRLLTENRMATINKRETSFEGLCASFEDGEDSVYNLITNDKNTEQFPIIGYKHHSNDNISWTKDRAES